MGQIKLSKYIKEIEKEFESGQYTHVIAHCRQILKQNSRYIGAYRLMGMALMGQQALAEAEDILQRVLSIDISDFIAHKILAEIMSKTERVEQSIWHIEHAFEIDPNDADVVLCRDDYYRQADLVAPVVNGMSLASVARLYIRSGIYDQAIEELNRMLVHNQHRLDWKAMLAVAYWRDGRNTEALQLSETVLEILPNNYEARMVLGDIWWQNGREEIASEHLDVLQKVLLIDQEQKDSYPIARQVLEQTGRLPLVYMVNQLDRDAIDDWSSLIWNKQDTSYDTQHFGEHFETRDDISLDQSEESGYTSSFSAGADVENALDDLFESFDDNSSLTEADSELPNLERKIE
ncbi:MAG: tetratricopeptide (TPR) repeat protein, partial [Candidatus Promineifilaceae bacterium]